MSQQEEITTETTIEGEALLSADGVLMIPTAGLPPGSTISLTITIGGEKPQPEPPAPQKPRHIGGGRTINGGAS